MIFIQTINFNSEIDLIKIYCEESRYTKMHISKLKWSYLYRL